ncbi:MAG: zf-HC2 domain-containing protein [Acidobacteriota bacterium]
MKCEECQPRIEEYLDRELNESAGHAVRKHLDNCVSCATVARDLEAEHAIYASYEPDLNISPELWAGVKARIVEDRVGSPSARVQSVWSVLKTTFEAPRISGWATAALVFLAIGSTAIFMKYTQSGTQPPTPQNTNVVENKPVQVPAMPITNSPVGVNDTSETSKGSGSKAQRKLVVARNNGAEKVRPAVGPRTPYQLVREAEQKYLAAIAMLSRNANRKRSQMDPATLARLDQAINSIDRTIAGTRQAVRQHPDDPVAVQYMLSAYARKVDVLREIAAN